MATDIRICVTGLSRSGKTVFITALVDALHKARLAPRAFPQWKAVASGRLRGASLQPNVSGLQHLDAFPYHQNLRDLTGDTPRWPESTEKTRAITIKVTTADQQGVFGKTMNWVMRQPDSETLAQKTVTIVDYPGEWVLDLPLLEQSFDTWSSDTLGMAGAEPRRSEAAKFMAVLERIDPLAPYDDGRAIEAHAAYIEYLEACRAVHKLSMLQPGLFLRPEAVGGHDGLKGREAFRFFPMRRSATSAKAGSFYRTVAGRFEAYKTDWVQPFFKSIHGSGKAHQVVLFDLLAALSYGEEAYNDARRALGRIADVMRPRPGLLARWFGAPPRILYAATKADHVSSFDRDHLRQHMSVIIGDLQAAQSGTDSRQATKAMAIAAIACTRDGPRKEGGVGAVGRVRNRKTGEICEDQVFAYPVPSRPPVPKEWAFLRETGAIGFPFPEFLLDSRETVGRPDLPHMDLDVAIEFLLGGHV
jgi:predicted YcjX-like family ATPase